MGYVLPVRPYRYTDYQRRMHIDTNDPMEIDKTFHDILTSQHYDIASEYSDPRHNYVMMNDEEEKQPLEKTYAQLTGIGRNFNDIV